MSSTVEGKFIILTGPYYATNAPLCCPTIEGAKATLSFQGQRWQESPAYFNVTDGADTSLIQSAVAPLDKRGKSTPLESQPNSQVKLRTANGDTLSDEFDAVHQCLSLSELSQTMADECERAYILVTELKARLEIADVPDLDPEFRSAMLKAIGDTTFEVQGQRLTASELMVEYAVLQFVLTARAANSTVLMTGNRFDLRLYYGQAFRAGNEVMASKSQDLFVKNCRIAIGNYMPGVRSWVKTL
jgi:hypothetical protein